MAEPGPDDELNFEEFAAAFTKIVMFPKSEEFLKTTSRDLVNHLIDFALLVFPRKDSIETLRVTIGKHISHEEMGAFVSGLEKYMDRVHPHFPEHYCIDEQSSATASVSLMNFTFALKFLLMEYVTWEEVDSVNDEGKAILQATGARFFHIFKKLKDMRSLITDGENRYALMQAVDSTADCKELLDRLLAEEDDRPVKETLIEDFFNKHAREDIWNKVFQVTNVNEFLERNPSEEKCCYCLTTRFDHGIDFALVNTCWDLYCLPCSKRISFGLGGRCAGPECNENISTYVSVKTYARFRDEIARGILGPFERHFLEPTQE